MGLQARNFATEFILFTPFRRKDFRKFNFDIRKNKTNLTTGNNSYQFDLTFLGKFSIATILMIFK